ncbi:MAG TPA: dTDP-4-dehydrorhamnose reductase [Thermohalobaculum sp.]|nr:dTDP-4-dehydrorhamnose reductase [Thermohalobaculum sp.]
MRVMVTGKSGQLARALAQVSTGRDDLSFHGRDTVDLAKAGAAAKAIAAARPDLVINAAAYTAVDQAESEPEAAHRLNAAAPGEIAGACADAGAALIHISTDYVFDGTGARAYRETDATGPIGVYGASKLAGEAAALTANPRTVVLRTSWVYSPWGRNFVLTMLNLARTRPELRIVDDQRGNPTSALDLAEACSGLAPRLAGAAAGDPVWGLYHYAGRGTCSWADFAAEIFALAARHGVPVPQIERIGTADYPTPARRPANSALDTSKFEATFGMDTVPWQQALARVIGMIMKESSA